MKQVTGEDERALATPVVLVVFNRPDCTRRVIEALAVVRPGTLYVAADGPRHAADKPKCDAVRRLFDDLPWACEVHRDFSEVNLGCGRRLPTGLDWVFQHEDRAIILEDDCVPDPSFFPFCEELLQRYADDPTVGCISGDVLEGVADFGHASYRFSWLPMIWGWATWRRAWQHYRQHVDDWPRQRGARWLRRCLPERLARRAQADFFDQAHAGGNDFAIWDYQWTYACMRHGMKTIQPRKTMISNVGFGPDATHTRNPNSVLNARRATPMPLPLSPPKSSAIDHRADIRLFHAIHAYVRRDHRPVPQRVRNKLKRLFQRAFPKNLRGKHAVASAAKDSHGSL